MKAADVLTCHMLEHASVIVFVTILCIAVCVVVIEEDCRMTRIHTSGVYSVLYLLLCHSLR